MRALPCCECLSCIETCKSPLAKWWKGLTHKTTIVNCCFRKAVGRGASSQVWCSFRRQEGGGRYEMALHFITKTLCRFGSSLHRKERICWCFFLEKILPRNFSVTYILARMAFTCFLETIPSTRKSWCFIFLLLEMTVFKSRTFICQYLACWEDSVPEVVSWTLCAKTSFPNIGAFHCRVWVLKEGEGRTTFLPECNWICCSGEIWSYDCSSGTIRACLWGSKAGGWHRCFHPSCLMT